MGLGQGYVILAYPEQFSILSVETMLSGGQEGCVPDLAFTDMQESMRAWAAEYRYLEEFPSPSGKTGPET